MSDDIEVIAVNLGGTPWGDIDKILTRMGMQMAQQMKGWPKEKCEALQKRAYVAHHSSDCPILKMATQLVGGACEAAMTLIQTEAEGGHAE